MSRCIMLSSKPPHLLLCAAASSPLCRRILTCFSPHLVICATAVATRRQTKTSIPIIESAQGAQVKTICLEQRLADTEIRLKELERQMKFHSTLWFFSVERDLVIAAGEVLKWSVKKRVGCEKDGRHFYDSRPEVQRMVMLGCRAYGEFGPNPDVSAVEAYKTLSQIVIRRRNATVHCMDIDALDKLVKHCARAIVEWPLLAEKCPVQARIILRYHEYKEALPECFQ